MRRGADAPTIIMNGNSRHSVIKYKAADKIIFEMQAAFASLTSFLNYSKRHRNTGK